MQEKIDCFTVQKGEMLKLIYVGRLDAEKGIEAIIFAIQYLISHHYNIHISIYGTGSYEPQITALSQQYASSVSYYGRQHKNDIIGPRSESDFFVMPSSFLETFGLTACESLLTGVPVIGNKKGGLLPFIDDSLDIQQYPGSHDGERLAQCIAYLIDHKISKSHYTTLIDNTKSHYTISRRWGQMNPLLEQHILMVSDFINYSGGGIETHIHDAKKILEDHHKLVTLYGHHAPKGRYSKIIKLGLMAINLLNIFDASVIRNRIQEHSITQVWLHSISRVIGRWGVRILPEGNHIISHHELGLFHPYPSRTTDPGQVPQARSWWSFVKAGKTYNPLKIFLITGKYLIVRAIHKQLKKKIKTHIVPSERMVAIVQQRHPQAHVVCIPHFVSLS